MTKEQILEKLRSAGFSERQIKSASEGIDRWPEILNGKNWPCCNGFGKITIAKLRAIGVCELERPTAFEGLSTRAGNIITTAGLGHKTKEEIRDAIAFGEFKPISFRNCGPDTVKNIYRWCGYDGDVPFKGARLPWKFNPWTGRPFIGKQE